MKPRTMKIYGGGRLGTWAIRDIDEQDILIGADSGALFLLQNGMRMDCAVGDFDSVTAHELQRIQNHCGEFLTFDPVLKNWTDMELAVDWAIENGADKIILYGAVGTRFDHSLANVHLLSRAADRHIPCIIEDEYNRISLVTPHKPLHIQKSRFSYVSLVPQTERVTGVTLQGMMYPLQDAELEVGSTLGISNKLVEQTGIVSIHRGRLLVIESMD